MRMPEISDKSVLLPQPLCPMMATNSPGAIEIETSLSASVSPSRPKYRRLTLRSSTLGAAAAPDGAATGHFALLKNSVTTRSANFTRLSGSSTWPCTRMSWNFSIAAGSITGEVFQILSRRAFGGVGENVRLHRREELGNRAHQLRDRRLRRPCHAFGDPVGPVLQRLLVLADVFVNRHEG